MFSHQFYTSGGVLFVNIFSYFDPSFIQLQIKDVLKPDLMSVVTAHVVYFCAFARSKILPKNTRELGVGRGQFHSGVNGLITC